MNEREKYKRFDALREIGCLCCFANKGMGLRVTNLRVEIHHQNAGGYAGQERMGDESTVPLCSWHHRGSWNEQAAPGGWDGLQWQERQEEVYGPSLAMGSKRFRPCYGYDAQLLTLANVMILVREGK